ncbi:rRNA pseudouridine synthase [Dehalococcoidia bacterium]|nr:rRNA pseudouridine synthase [Dehalococcoidia bacterium]
MPVHLLKCLTEAGLGSRRKLADAIRQGRVQVNGIVAEDFRQAINPQEDSVILDGQQVSLGRPRTICLMLHKPRGVISTVSDERGRQTVLDILPGRFRGLRLYPVGRLDKESSGLLLLTNDGNLTYHLTHPRFEQEKEYLVAVEGILKPAERRRLERGIELADGTTSPARVRMVHGMEPFNYSITIHEGRKRQVRRMFEELGYQVLALRRVRIGKLALGDLREGEVRRLSADEIESLRSCHRSLPGV